MAELVVGQRSVKLDDEDVAGVLSYGNWHICNGYASKYTVGSSKYTVGSSKRRKRLLMHRVILNLPTSPGQTTTFVVDHINGDRLDNRKINLRVTTRRINALNSSVRHRANAGVSMWRQGKYQYWRAMHKNKTLGYFKTKEEAVKAYNLYIDTALEAA